MTRSYHKGASAEREVVALAKSYGFTGAFRVPMSGAHSKLPGDIAGIPLLHVECKRHEALRLDDWHRQAEGDCPAGHVPVLVYRRSHNPWRISIDAEHFLPIYRRSLAVLDIPIR